MDSSNLKKLVVFYSYDGNTKFIANSIAGEIGADVLELKTKNQKKLSGFLKYFLLGFQVITKRKPALQPLEKSIDNYDIIFIGTPIWAGSFSSPLNTYFYLERPVNKKIAFFCTYSDNDGNVIENMKNALSENIMLGSIGFISPLTRSKDKCSNSAKEWAKKMVDKVAKK